MDALIFILKILFAIVCLHFIFSFIGYLISNKSKIVNFQTNKENPFLDKLIEFKFYGQKCVGYIYLKNKTNDKDLSKVRVEDMMVAIIYEDGSTQHKTYKEIVDYSIKNRIEILRK